MDYRNNITDDNIVIYGHNRKDKSMFGSLKNILKKEYYENNDNKKISFTTINGKEEYEIYSAFVINDEDIENYIKLNFNNDEEFNKFIKSTINSSYIKTDTKSENIKSIITLYTCHGNGKKLLVFAYKKE